MARLLHSRRLLIFYVLSGALLFLAVCLTQDWGYAGDVGGYLSDFVKPIFAGRLPYRDFPVCYPPLSFAPFLSPAIPVWLLGQDWQAYFGWFAFSALACSMLLSYLLVRFQLRFLKSERRAAVTLLLYTVFVCLLSPLLVWRYDIFPAILVLIAIYALSADKPALSGLALALGVGAKIFPIVLLPVHLLFCWTQGLRRACLPLIGSFTVITLLVFLVPYLYAGRGAFSFLTFAVERSLNLESLSGGALALKGVVAEAPVSLGLDHYSWNINGAQAAFWMSWLPYLFLAAFACFLVLVHRCFRQERRDNGTLNVDRLIYADLMALIIFILFNKVLSPQFLIWLIPCLALAKPRYGVLFSAICLITLVLLHRYLDLLNLKPLEVWLLNIRNGLLLALGLWVLIKELAPTKEGRLRAVP